VLVDFHPGRHVAVDQSNQDPFEEKTMKSRLAAVLACVGAFIMPSAAANSPTAGFVVEVYIHDCCGRGPYVAVVLDRNLTNQPACSLNPTILATSPNAPLAQYLFATALAAKIKARQVVVHSKGSCDSTGVFDEWIGIEMP
jgi:hypothetical protein